MISRSYIIFLFFFAAVSFSIGVSYELYKPKAIALIRKQIKEFNKKNPMVSLNPQEISFGLFPPQISLKQLLVRPKGKLKLVVPNIFIVKNVQIVIGLSKGFHPELRQIKLSQAQVDLLIDVKADLKNLKKENSFFKMPIKDLKFLKKIPLKEIILEEFNISGYLPTQQTSFRIENLFASLSKDSDETAYVHFVTSRLNMKTVTDFKKIKEYLKSQNLNKTWPFLEFLLQSGQNSLDIGIQAKIYASKDQIKLLPLRIQKEGSSFTASGNITGHWLENEIKSIKLKISSRLKLKDFSNLIKKYYKKEIPNLSGIAEVNLDIKKLQNKDPEIGFSLKISNFFINQYRVGQLIARGYSLENESQLSEFQIKNSAGSLDLKNIRIVKKNKQYSLSIHSHLKKIDLAKLLDNLGIKGIPLLLKISGQSACEGKIYPKFDLSCNGKLSSEKLTVNYKNQKNKNLIDLAEISAGGSVQINSKNISYDVLWRVKDASGSSQGTIDFKKGFQISYRGRIPKLKQIDNLLDLRLSGQSRIEGKIQGTSKTVSISMKIKNKDLQIVDIQTGANNIVLKYKSGILTHDFKGVWNKTNYHGSLLLNLLDNKSFLNVNSSNILLDDLKFIFKTKLPFEITGSGSGQFKAWGPIDNIQKQDYELTAKIKNGSIAQESFDQLNLSLHSNKGLIETSKLELTRSVSRLSAKISISPEKNIRARFEGTKIRMSESESIKKLGLNIEADLDLKGEISGSISHPNLSVSGIAHSSISSDEDIELELNLNKEQVLSGNFKHKHKEDFLLKFQYPLKENSSAWIKLKTKDWNLKEFFGSNYKKHLPYGFESKLSINSEIRTPNRNWLNSTGFIKINSFLIRRGSSSMNVKKPIHIRIRNGRIRASNARLEGPKNFLEIQIKNSSLRNLGLKFKGNLDISPALFAFPSLEDLQGQVSFTTQLKGNLYKPIISGAAYLDNIYIKFLDFPQPIQEMRADLLFNKKGVVINSLNGKFSKGEISANGKINFQESGIPINISATWKKGELHFPEGIHTRGSAKFQLIGKKKPYTLKGSYNITGGNIEKNFSQIEEAEKTILVNSYLPKFLDKATAEPVSLDLKIKIDKPLQTQLLIAQATLKTNITGYLKAMGSPKKPLFTGRISGQKGEARFQRNVFEIKTGLISYNNQFIENPEVYIRAQSSVDNYDINLIAQGLASDLKLRFTSQPKLPESDIISLLTLGYTPKEFDKTFDSTQQAEQSGVQFGSLFLQEHFGINNALKNELGLGVNLTSNYNKDENVSVTSIVVNKQWSPNFGSWNPKLNISAKRTLEKEASNEVKIEYKVNKNLSAIGLFENQELDTIQSTDSNTFGIDLEYKIEFK